ncbi:hypothetical protein PIROE2DRAFT_63454 [Piromyces sp. E2]|nr:hypothetical protein PIROE2DRAFT_63454 [Piromyces sp. E2]|eukprot:OUM59927.1 hypothetical protein PIROE2DRAFT_63454 [Piromyces sp. E2]
MNFDIIKILIKNKAVINTSNSNGSSPLNILCQKHSKKSKEIIDYLIKNGADVNYKDENGITPLLTTCYFSNEDILKYLIENKDVDINKQNNDKDTPLIISKYFNNENIKKYLLNNKADKFIKNKNGDMFTILLDENVIINSKNDINTVKVKKESFKDENGDKNNFIFTSELIDVTFIELSDRDIKNPDFTFFDLDNDFNDGNKQIFVFQYPEGKLSFSTGNIISSSFFNYHHTASTKGGSSGSPLLNENMKVIGIHRGSFHTPDDVVLNIGTKFSYVQNAINILFNKSYINDITKARKTARKLSDDEEKELENHGLNKMEEKELCNVYKCPYFSKNYLGIMYYYRTNHGWYFTLRDDNKIKNKKENDLLFIKIKTFSWIFINPYKKYEEIINEFKKLILEEFFNEEDKKHNRDRVLEFNNHLDHRHELIISWLKASELMYM